MAKRLPAKQLSRNALLLRASKQLDAIQRSIKLLEEDCFELVGWTLPDDTRALRRELDREMRKAGLLTDIVD